MFVKMILPGFFWSNDVLISTSVEKNQDKSVELRDILGNLIHIQLKIINTGHNDIQSLSDD
jgi:hypothetical protein